jgi:hypothetical protein
MKKPNNLNVGKILKASDSNHAPTKKFTIKKLQLTMIFASFALIGGLVGAALFIRSKAGTAEGCAAFQAAFQASDSTAADMKLRQLPELEASLAAMRGQVSDAVLGGVEGQIVTLKDLIARQDNNTAAEKANFDKCIATAPSAVVPAVTGPTAVVPSAGCLVGQNPVTDPSPTCWTSCGDSPVFAATATSPAATTWTLRGCLDTFGKDGKYTDLCAPATIAQYPGCSQYDRLPGCENVEQWFNWPTCRKAKTTPTAPAVTTIPSTTCTPNPCGTIPNVATPVVPVIAVVPPVVTVPPVVAIPATPVAKTVRIEWTPVTTTAIKIAKDDNIDGQLSAKSYASDSGAEFTTSNAAITYYIKDVKGVESLAKGFKPVPGKYALRVVVKPNDGSYLQAEKGPFNIEIAKLDQPRPPASPVAYIPSAFNSNERVLGAVLGTTPSPYGTPFSAAMDPRDSAPVCNLSTVKYTPPLGTVLEVGVHSIDFFCQAKDPVWFNDISDKFDVTITKAEPLPNWTPSARDMVQGTALTAAHLNAKVTDRISGADITSQGLGVYTSNGAPVTVGSQLGAPGTYTMAYTWTPSGQAGTRYTPGSSKDFFKITAASAPAVATPVVVAKPVVKAPAVVVKPKAPVVSATAGTPSAPVAVAPVSPVPVANDNAIEIKDLWLDSVDKTSAVLVWKTNKPTKSEVQYGPTEAYGFTESDASAVTDHKVTIKSGALKAGTSYHAKVVATDDKGTVASSPDFTFTTSGYYVTLKMLGKDGKPLPAGVVVKLGGQEATTDTLGNAVFSSVSPGSQEVSYVLGGKTVTAPAVSVAESDSPQEISVKTTYGSSKSGSGLLIILLLALLLIPLVLFLLWFLKKRNSGDDSGYGSGSNDGQDYFATYGQQPAVPAAPVDSTGTNWQQQVAPQQPASPAAPSGDNHNFPWAQ